MDLQALMMGSESLLTHIARPDGIPRLDKSLAEIVSAPSVPAVWREECLEEASPAALLGPVAVLFCPRLECLLQSRPHAAANHRRPNGHSMCGVFKLNR